MGRLANIAAGLLRGYSRIAPTERGGFHLARAVRSLIPRNDWRGRFKTPDGLLLDLDLATYPDVAMAFGLYELDTRRILARLLRPGHRFLDGGANIGYFTLLAAGLVGPDGHVDSFEPDPANRQRLIDHLRLNNLSDRVTVHEEALSDTAGRVPLYQPNNTTENHGQATLFIPQDDQRPSDTINDARPTTLVQTVRLDEAIGRPPNVVKLDIEGGELAAVRGMSGWFGNTSTRGPSIDRGATNGDIGWDDVTARDGRAGRRVPKIIIEHNHASAGAAGYAASDIYRALRDHHPAYRARWIGVRLWSIISPEELEKIIRQGNVLFE